ncbi:hypothetical protein K440DRAFT_236816 [Wilcoxina mikolae CBS 423.85]|nr:hypothetical protein K440DRAFT_236816 [Wilcoxina mikolae CBS 423.85]
MRHLRLCSRNFFFGTPHEGLDVEDLRKIVSMQTEDNAELRYLLDQLNNDSEFLQNQKDGCTPMWKDPTGKVYSFYELQKTETVIQEGPHFRRGGTKVQRVTKFSAQLFIRQELQIPTSSNHTAW